MPLPAFLIPALLTGAAGLGGFLGGRKRTQQQTGSTMPTLDPKFQSLQDLALSASMERLKSGGLPPGYGAQGISRINRTFNVGRQGTLNDLTARGLSGGPESRGIMATLDAGRLGQISNFQTSLPLIEREQAGMDLDRIVQLLGLGRGTSTTGSLTQDDGTGGFAGGFSDIGQMLGFLFASGAFGRR